MHRLNFTINEALYEQATLILEANDKKEILEILANDKFISNNDFKEKYNIHDLVKKVPKEYKAYEEFETQMGCEEW